MDEEKERERGEEEKERESDGESLLSFGGFWFEIGTGLGVDERTEAIGRREEEEAKREGKYKFS